MDDAKRLDWIDRNGITISGSSQRGYSSWFVTYLDGSTDKKLLNQSYGSVREAIDAAMQNPEAPK
jgi:hypothetical protein